MDATDCAAIAVDNVVVPDLTVGRRTLTGVEFFLDLGMVAVSPRERIGWFPVSLTVTVLLDCVGMCLRIGLMLRNPKHFWKYSVVTIFCCGSVELTLSEGGIL